MGSWEQTRTRMLRHTHTTLCWKASIWQSLTQGLTADLVLLVRNGGQSRVLRPTCSLKSRSVQLARSKEGLQRLRDNLVSSESIKRNLCSCGPGVLHLIQFFWFFCGVNNVVVYKGHRQ